MRQKVKWGRGIPNFVPVAVLLALLTAAVLEAAVLLLLWLAVAVAVTALVCNPWRIFDRLIDVRSRGLWATAISSLAVAALLHVPLGWIARLILVLMAALFFWLGWAIRQPAPLPPSVLVQSDVGDNVIGQLHSKVNGHGLQKWTDGGKGRVRAVLHQAFSYAVTEVELDQTGRAAYAVGYGDARTEEAALRAKVEKMEKEWWRLTDSTEKARELEERVRELEHSEWEKDCLIEHLQNQLMAAEDKILVIPDTQQDRDAAIRQAVEDGASQSHVAALYGLSRARINQICKAG